MADAVVASEPSPSSESPADPLWDDWDVPPLRPTMPELHLDGFDGPLDLLLDLAERQRIDLGRLSIADLAAQFVAALARLERHVPLPQRADWLVLATRLVLLRTRLLFPGTPEAAAEAEREADEERARLEALQFIRAAATWLDTRPQLGREVFARGQTARDPCIASYMRLMEACLTVLTGRAGEGGPEHQVYRPAIPELFRVAEAIQRIRARLAELAGPRELGDFLPRIAREVPRFITSATTSTPARRLKTIRAGADAPQTSKGESVDARTLASRCSGLRTL